MPWSLNVQNKGTTRKAWIIFDQGRKIQIPTGQKRRHTSSRHIECPFSTVAKVEGSETDFRIEIKDLSYSHGPCEPSAHPGLRQMARTSSV